jgi:hypothetical protein
MEIKEFVEMLKTMLKNPNAIDEHNGVIYFYTSSGDLISLS